MIGKLKPLPFLILVLFCARSACAFAAQDIPELIEKLGSADDHDKLVALRRLKQFGPKAAPAVPALVTNLNGGQEVSAASAEVLLSIGEPAVSDLIHSIDSPPPVGERVLGILAKIKPVKPEAVTAVLEAVNVYDRLAIQLLGLMGPAAAPAIPKLTAIARGQDASNSKQDSLNTLFQIGSASIPSLVLILNDDHVESYLRASAANGLGFLHAVDSGTIAALQGGLHAPEPYEADIRVNAATSLGLAGEPARIAIPDLKHALEDKAFKVRLAAAKALEKLGDPSGKAFLNSQEE